MNTFFRNVKWVIALAMIIAVFHTTTQTADAASNRPLSSVSAGETINFGGKQWILLDPSKGFIILRDFNGSRGFEYNVGMNNTIIYDPNDYNSIAYGLNRTFYDSLTNKECIHTFAWNVKTDGSLGSDYASAGYEVRPELYLKSGLYLTPSGDVIDVPYDVNANIATPTSKQVFTDASGYNLIALTGSVKGDPGVQVNVKYTIDGINAHTVFYGDLSFDPLRIAQERFVGSTFWYSLLRLYF